MLIGPGFAETDISLTKTTRITERLSLQIKAEMFNLFNHPNFSVPAATIINAGTGCGPASTAANSPGCYNPTGAAITSLVGSGGLPDVARQTQFSAKLTF